MSCKGPRALSNSLAHNGCNVITRGTGINLWAACLLSADAWGLNTYTERKGTTKCAGGFFPRVVQASGCEGIHLLKKHIQQLQCGSKDASGFQVLYVVGGPSVPELKGSELVDGWLVG